MPLAACSRTYHPEYHPETSYSYVQNVTYAEHVWNVGHAEGEWESASEPAPTKGAGPRTPPRPEVTPSGIVVIYGDVYGDVQVRR
jgi:hypothetical protein